MISDDIRRMQDEFQKQGLKPSVVYITDAMAIELFRQLPETIISEGSPEMYALLKEAGFTVFGHDYIKQGDDNG